METAMFKKTRNKRVNAQQMEYLINFISDEKNSKILTLKTNSCKEGELKILWEKVAAKLNKIGGPIKTLEEWRRFFVEYKLKTKAKARLYIQEQKKTGGGENETKALTAFEEKLMAHVGWVCVTGVPDLPPEIESTIEEHHINQQNQTSHLSQDGVLVPDDSLLTIREKNGNDEVINCNNKEDLPTANKRKRKILTKKNHKRSYQSKESMLDTSASKFVEGTEKFSEAIKEFSDAIKILAASINNLAEKM